jgi:molybdopterin-guanine dinucleotide biosynthesis protein A
MRPVNNNDVTVVILAGGKGRRMGGKDKGLIAFKNDSLIKHIIDAISQQTNTILINANRNIEKYAEYGYPVIEDSLSDFQGPLAGFMAAMSVAETDYILTLPCDGPIIVENYVEEMISRLNRTGSEIVVASDGQRMQPVYALIPVKLQSSLQKFLGDGERKIDKWYQQHQTSLAEFNDESGVFTNMNTPEDIKKFS